MGFPLAYSEIFLPKLFINILSILDFIAKFIFSFFNFLGLSDFLEPNTNSTFLTTPTRLTENPPVTAVLIREFLPIVKFKDIPAGAGKGEVTCPICLNEYEGGEEIRWLTNCKHIFHRSCLDRWMDQDQKACPLCRIQFVPFDLQNEFNRRLWAVSGISDDYV